MLIGPDGGVPTTGIHLLPARDDDAIEPLDVATTMTDWTGAFTFAAVPPGQYVLSVARLPQPPPDVDGAPRVTVTPGGTMTIASNPGAPPPGPPPVPPDATLVAQVPLSIGERGLADLVVSLSAGPRVSGRIEFEGTIDKPPAESVAGLRITLDPADGTKLADWTLAN